ncbi:MAG: AAA family ATPase [Shewanella sp.]
MKFTFKKIGFIDSGEVELGDLTVICGRNNTGKTYVSHSVYGLLKKCNTQRVSLATPEHLDKLFKDGECTVDIPNVSDLLAKVSKEFSKTALKDVFNSEIDTFKNGSVSLTVDDICNEKFSGYESELIFRLGEDSDTELRINTKSNEKKININLINPNVSRGFVQFALDKELSQLVLGAFIPNSFVITSERTGAAMFYKDLDSQAHSILDHIVELKDNKRLDPFSLMEKMRSRYSLPIRSNIDSMRYAQEATKNKSDLINEKEKHENVIKKLKQIVGGTYKTLVNGVYYVPNKQRNREKVELPMHLSSSATKSLYLLDLYLRHIAKIGDVLIIDEPELNLHPDAQRLLAQLLVRVVKAGIKIIITTHSDHLLRELNTLVMLSSSNIDEQEKSVIFDKYSLSSDDLIEPSRVKAYVNSSTTHKIHKMNVDGFGIHMGLFNEEINKSTGLSKEVYYLIS